MARGSVRRVDGGWEYTVDLGPDPATGRRRQRRKQGFPNKKAAEAALDEVVRTVRDGTYVPPQRLTVGEYLDSWLVSQSQRLRATTHASYAISVARIKRAMGAAPLSSLTPLQIERFYAELGATGGTVRTKLAPKSVRNTHVVLRKALADAERLGLVLRNAAAAAKPPSDDRKEQATWSSDQLREFFAYVRNDRLFAVYVVLATTGMRRGEVLGLRWSDVDFDAYQLSVVQTITTVDRRPVLSPPKTPRSRRVVYLDAQTLAVLKAHRKQQIQERLAAGAAWSNEGDWLFRDEIGHHLHPDWFSREFGRQAALAGLPRIRVHDVRHTYATLALKAGVHPKVVSERLGHATVGVTLDLYSHVTPAIARDAADVVAAKIFDP